MKKKVEGQVRWPEGNRVFREIHFRKAKSNVSKKGSLKTFCCNP